MRGERGGREPLPGVAAESPLAPTQRALVRLLREQGLEARHVFECALPAPVDVGRLRAALGWLARRHDALRAFYPRLRGGAEPVWAAADPAWQPSLELLPLDEADQQGALAALRETLQAEPAALDAGPHARFVLARSAGPTERLLCAVPALNADRRSLAVLVAELDAAYRAGGEAPVAPPPQFRDVAAWLRGEAADGAPAAAASFWRRSLAALPPAAELPLGRVARGRRAVLARALAWTPPVEAAAAVEGLDAAALEARLTAATLAWLARLGASAAVDVVFDGRDVDELRDAVGPYERHLPLAAAVDAGTTFADLERTARARLDELREWQEWFRPEALGDEERAAFQAAAPAVAVELREGAAVADDGERAVRLAGVVSAGTHALRFAWERAPGGLRAEVTYDAGVYAPATASLAAAQLGALLPAFVREPWARVLDADCLAPEDAAWARAPEVEPWPAAGDTLVELFERQAARAPDAVASVDGPRQLTYGALDRLANALARRLRARAATGPEARVGVCLGPSWEAHVAILAVLKTGSAWVPVDPEWPQRRLDDVLRDAAAVALVTAADPGARASRGVPSVACDAAALWADGPVSAGPRPPVAPASLAYVLYTSGTSGRPKGAMVTQAGLVNYLTWCADAYEVAAGRGALAHSPLTFDFTLTALFAPLLVGRGVHFCRGDHPLDALADELARLDEASLVKLTPTAVDPLRRLLATRGAAARVRRLVIGGEALSGTRSLWALARRLGASVVNEYGPTECVVGSIVFETAPDETLEGPVPIGRPIARTSAHVLGRRGRAAPTWAEGELHLGGWGLARGYLNQPGPTAAAFVPRAHGGRPGERLYRTGDVARRLANGDLLYLGRRDGQVKLRGFRVELAEVEQALRRHADVADCAAALAPRDDAPPQLAAFVVPERGAAPDAAALRAHLAELLPEYMLPSALHVVPALPVTANGKIDLAALLGARSERARPLLAPRTEVERTLQRLWREVLRRESVGIDENFFELGGDSILSIQFLARANEAGLRLKPRHLEDHPTIIELAPLARAAPVTPAAAPATGEVPLAPIQRWFLAQGFAEPRHHNQSLLLRADGRWSAAQYESALWALSERHEALRLCFDLSGPEPRQRRVARVERRLVTALDGAGLDEAEWSRRLRAAALEAQRGLDLGAAPLLAAVVAARPERGETLLYLVAHHLVVDHVSWSLLLDDLRAALEQLASGARAVSWSAPAPSYSAWTEREAARARLGPAPAEAAYWLSERWRAVAPPPLDRPGEPNLVADEDSVSIALSAADTRRLLHDAGAAYATRVPDLLLAAYALAHSAWSGARAVAVDLEGHGRVASDDSPDAARAVGWFTALYPVLLTLSNPRDLRATVREVKEALRAVPADAAAYGRLRYLAPESEFARACVELHAPAVAFNYLGDVDALAASRGPLQVVPEWPAPNRAPGNRRTHLIEVGARVHAGELTATFSFSRRLHERATLQALAQTFAQRLRALVEHCCAVPARGFTPSDFPLAGLDQEDLDALVAAQGDVEDVYPLTPTQKGLLFHATRSPSGPAYFVQLRVGLAGSLDAPAFEESWRRVTARHTALRTSFAWEGLSEPLQVVHRHAPPALVQEDWRARAGEERLAAWLAADRARGFDLSRAPLQRLALLRLDDERWLFVWSYHHILLDGWSTANVLREVLDAYAQALGLPGGEPGAPGRYRDHVEWLQARPADEDRDYWRRALDGLESGTALALPKPRGAPAAGAHAEEWLALESSDARAVTDLARSFQVTPNVVVQGAWALVLGRYARRDDVVFGVTVSGRPYDLPQVERRVGLFLNTLPARVRIEPRLGVGAYLERVSAGLRELLHHEHTPLVDARRLCRLPEREPLFDSLLVFENFPMLTDLGPLGERLRVEGVVSSEQTNYPLTLVVGTQAGALSVKALYDPAALEAAAVRRVLAHLGDTLRFMARAPAAPLAALPAAWTCPPATPPPRACDDVAWAAPLHRLFERQAAARPDAVAVVEPAGGVTYGALNRRANQLARRLRRQGAGPDAPVALCLERSAGMITAVLATLKAGAAYVPIDARFPSRRVELLAAKAALVVVDRVTRGHFEAWSASALVDLDDATDPAFAGRASDLRGVDPPLDQAAYLMHTSGSSGQPKGTLVTHRNVARLFAAAQRLDDGFTGGVWSFFHSLAFDFSVWEIFGALLTGGRLVIVPYWVARSPHECAALLCREGVTLLSQTPSAFQQLLVHGRLLDAAEPSALRRVVFGGEALHLAPLRADCPELERRGVRLVNMYGITETTVHVTYRALDDWAALDELSRIGRPLPDLRLHLLDRGLHAVPEGVPGELVVAGAGVTPGYAGAPRLTAERFVPSPFADDGPGARLYRSGDLGRRLDDGDLEYLGRGDTQVKIRGFRIEPDEVCFHLRRLPGVRDALVRVTEDRAGDRVLAAYVVPVAGDLALPALWDALREQLPEHMLPAAIVPLERFPLTGNGKIDHAALPAPGADEAQAERGRVPPQTWEQDLAADAWREVLGLHEVGIHDDFFELGGDSIKALRVVARLRALGLAASTEALFEHPSIAALSRSGALATPAAPPDEQAAASVAGELEALAGRLPAGVLDAYPATQMQLGMVFHAAEAAGETPYHNVTLVTLRGRFDEARFRGVVADLAARHPALRTSFDLETYGLPLQLVQREVRVPVELTRHPGLSADARRAWLDQWMATEKRRLFDLRQAPLVRFHVALFDDELIALGLTEHHAILDGWSVASLLTELFQLYVSPAGRAEAPPPDAARAYALLERAALASPAQRDFWRDTLDECPPLRLPARLDDGDAPPAAGVRKQRVRLEADLAAGLRALAHDAQTPLKSVLLAAHLAVLGHLCDAADTLTGLITHGRPEIEGGEAGLGLFLNTLPLRVRHARTSWKRWARRVFDEERRLLPYRRYPLAAMRDARGEPPQLATAFNYTNFHVYERLRQDAPVEVLDVRVHETTNFALLTDFSLLSRTGELDLTLSYDGARFGERQIAELLEAYLRCLRLMTADPSAAVTDARLWPEPPAPVQSADAPAWTDARALVAAAADPARSERVAAVDGGRHLSFRELARRTRALSARLRGLGVAEERPVAVLLDKSLEWLIAALAVIDAGGVYAPVDPRDPPERVRFIVDHVGAELALTDEAGEALLRGGGVRVLRVDGPEPASPPPPARSARVHPDDLLYVLYTSGSTGRPKGVALHHGALANLMSWQARALPLEGRRVLQYASVGFDVSVQELLTTLAGAGTLVLVPGALRRDFVSLARLVDEQQVECVFAPDTVLKALWLAARAEGTELPSLRALVNAGEPLTVDDALARFVARGGELHNHYGPTESHVVTAARVGAAETETPGGASIGGEIARTELLLLDGWLRPVPAGSVAEMSIASVNVARGYHRAPRLTAERFLPHPGPRARPGERVFRTGDLGRRARDGRLTFLGRRDTQVKLRGYRVELDEVRHALLRHPDVEDAVVDLAEGGEKHLRAWVVARGGTSSEALREFVSRALPGYMVPASVTRIEAVPTTRNGKVDRRALRALLPAERAETAPAAALDELGRRLLEIWREVLGPGVEVGPGDDFLRAGGSSIGLLQLQLRLRSRLGVEVGIARLALESSFTRMHAYLRAELERPPAAAGGPSSRGERAFREGSSR